MKLEIHNGILYADNIRVCFAETTIPKGKYDMNTAYSHMLGEVLPQINGVGWFGKDVTVGNVKNQEIIPCHAALQRIVNIITAHEDIGIKTTLEIV